MKKIISVLMIAMMCCLTACGVDTTSNNTPTNSRTYDCDYKTLAWNTKIVTTVDGEEVTIEGNIFTLFTDPLTVKDSEGNTIGYAGDTYGIIEQDDHGIYINGEFDVNMCGNFDMFGESYKLKDSEGDVVANIEFNMTNTGGAIKDVNGNLVAKYSSNYFLNDYTVIIYDNNVCSDLSILMIVASYVSDYKADSSN